MPRKPRTYTADEAIQACADHWQCDPDDLLLMPQGKDENGNAIHRVYNTTTGMNSDSFRFNGFLADKNGGNQ